MKLLLLLLAAWCGAGLPSGTLSIMSYNIMDSGFADESGRYDPVGDRVTKNGKGNLTNFMRGQAPFVDVLGVVETGAWTANGTADHPGYLQIAHDWGYEHVHVRGNCAIMSHAPLEVVDERDAAERAVEQVADAHGRIQEATNQRNGEDTYCHVDRFF